MRLSKFISITRIEFIVTWQCGGKCKHCQSGNEINQPSSHSHVLMDYATEAIYKLSTAYEVESVMTFGGEPLYYPEVTAAIHEAATKCSIKTRQIITNGYFTNNPEKSSAVANSLADSGVNSLLLSVDALHQEHIPLEPVRQFARNIVEAEIPGAILYPAWVVDRQHRNPYNTKTKEILEQFADIAIDVGCNDNVIYPSGHAAKFLRDYYGKTELNLSESCISVPYSELLTDIKTISIVPNGDVMVCGFVIGNIYREDIIDVVTRYNPYENDAMRAILRNGIAGLVEYAEAQGVTIDTAEYCNTCDVCHAIVKQLK
ncbi:MAG: radical SAM protein [Oscillospiraceae bacterium]|nr:radical SAM protein [Oscillospiraceae bacterium]